MGAAPPTRFIKKDLHPLSSSIMLSLSRHPAPWEVVAEKYRLLLVAGIRLNLGEF
jgi:hypothetical protein